MRCRPKRRARDATRSLELFGFVEDWLASVHCLHSKHLVIALLVIEHGGGEVIENVFGRERTVCLEIES